MGFVIKVKDCVGKNIENRKFSYFVRKK